MVDRVPLYPGRVKLVPVAGQENTYDMVRSDSPTQEGTPLNKAALLKDETAALYGLDATAVPDDVLAEIGKYKQYWWKRKKVTYVEKQKKSDESLCDGDTTATVTYADSISIDQLTGAISLVNPQTVTIDSISTANTLLGKYCKTVNITPEKILKYPESNVNWEFNSGWPHFIRGTPVYIITAEANIANTAEYVRSSDRNAYPDSGMQGGYAYEYLGIPFDNAVTALKYETGSYAGTGTCGESNPNILTFEFDPKAIFMWRILSNASDLRVYNVLEVTTYISAIPADNVYYYGGFDSPTQTRGKIKRSIDGKTITWYSTDPGYQHNLVGSTYYYIAIG